MPQSQEDPGSRLGGSLAAGAAVLLAVTCCAGPVLVAAGALGVAGGLLRSPAVLAIAALALVGAVLYVLHRRRSGRAAASQAAICSVAPTGEVDSKITKSPFLSTGAIDLLADSM